MQQKMLFSIVLVQSQHKYSSSVYWLPSKQLQIFWRLSWLIKNSRPKVGFQDICIFASTLVPDQESFIWRPALPDLSRESRKLGWGILWVIRSTHVHSIDKLKWNFLATTLLTAGCLQTDPEYHHARFYPPKIRL